MKIFFFTAIILGSFAAYQFLIPPFGDSRESFSVGRPSSATLIISGGEFEVQFDAGLTVAEVIRRAGFTLAPDDQLYPIGESAVFTGARIVWQPAREIQILVDGKEVPVRAISSTVEEIIREAGVVLDEDDLVTPAFEAAVPTGKKIAITRVEVKEEVKETKIPYATKTEEDGNLSWRKKIVTQKGENGLKRTTYKVSYHNGKEVNRKTLATEVVKEPVTEVVTQGTLVKTGKAHRGAASWYAWTGTMAAANPWLPKGSYVKVTNIDNGKSVIVVINDRGPFVPGRIIDLDKVAFEKIASIGAGVINVKMEEITN